jgi:hypothetical protein
MLAKGWFERSKLYERPHITNERHVILVVKGRIVEGVHLLIFLSRILTTFMNLRIETDILRVNSDYIMSMLKALMHILYAINTHICTILL